MDNRPIGIFDSGLGGLTVLKEIIRTIPGESAVYFGDSGRAPYGTKSRETVLKYSFQNLRFLQNHDIKMVVIACNTASACSYEQIKLECDLPVVEVIQPGAAAAIKATRNKKIGIIGTSGTIDSGVYDKALTRLDSSIRIFSKACPLFVSLAEEGWWDNDIAFRVAEEYLLPLKQKGIDTLVLGCTHYPLLQKTIGRVMGKEVTLVNSAQEVAGTVADILKSRSLFSDNNIKPVYRYYTSDSISKFEMLGGSFLDKKLKAAGKVDIEQF